MGRVTEHLARRQVPLAARFRRGVWLGVVVTATVGLGTLILTEAASRSVGSAHEIAALAAKQRLDLSQLSSDLSRLAGTEDPTLRSEYRTLVGDGRALDHVVAGLPAGLLLADSSMAHMTVAAANGKAPVPRCGGRFAVVVPGGVCPAGLHGSADRRDPRTGSVGVEPRPNWWRT